MLNPGEVVHMNVTVQDVFDRLERPHLQSATGGTELSTASVAARSLRAATALRHRLRSHADTAPDVHDEALRRNELALLQCHLHWLLDSSSAQLRAAGEHAQSSSQTCCIGNIHCLGPRSCGAVQSSSAFCACQIQRMLD